MSLPSNVLIVIGSGGMGLAIARRLAGGRRLIIADYSQAQLEAASKILRSEGYSPQGVEVDVSDINSVKKLAQTAAEAGRIDVVVHTAGVSPITASAEQIYKVDLLGTANVIDAFFAVVSAGTSLVCVASMAGHLMPLPADLERHLATAPTDQLFQHGRIDLTSGNAGEAYVISKRGNQLRVQAACHEWGRKGARINSISPGVIATAKGQAELEGPEGAQMRAMIELSGARRIGTTDDIANTVAFLAGPESSFITGNDISVDGGTVSTQRWNKSG